MPDHVGTLAVEQLILALTNEQATTRALTEQLGAANATIATLAISSHKRLHPDPITVGALYEKFKAIFEAHKSWAVMRNRLEPFVAFFYDRLADSVKPSDWPPYREKRLRDVVKGPMSKSGRTVSKRTVNHELGWAKRLFNWGADEEQGLVVCNPFARTRRIKLRKGRETWIAEEDAQRMLDATAPASTKARTMLRAFFLVMIDTGLRFNEARKLRRDRIRERPDGRIVVDVGRTKNGKSHLVGLTSRAFNALAEIEPVEGSADFFAHLRRLHGASKETPPVPLLISERQLRRWFREMCVASGVDARVADGDVRLKPHDIRHSAATLAHRRGASVKAVQRMLNHSDVSTTMRYIHDEEDDAIAIADIMERGIALASKPEPGRRRSPHRATPPHMSGNGRTDFRMRP